MKGKFKGYLLGAAAAASYGLNPAFTLPLYSDGMNPESVLILRYGLAVMIAALLIIIRRGSFRVPAKSIPQLAGLGILMALSSLTLFISYKYMAAGIASTILFVYPVMVAVIMALFFGERLSFIKIACILAATAGVGIMYRTGDGQTLSLAGTLIVISSALSYAVYLVAVNRGSAASADSFTLTFYVLLFGSVLFWVRLLLTGTALTLPGTWYLWLDAAALGIFPTIISLVCTAKAIQLTGSTATAILGALEPVTAVITGMLFFGEGMTLREAAGILMILAAVSLVVYSNSREESR